MSTLIYEVLDVSTLDETQRQQLFIDLKLEDIIQNSYDTARKSLDNTKTIIKWADCCPTPTTTRTTIFQGSLSELNSYLQTNSIDWEESSLY